MSLSKQDDYLIANIKNYINNATYKFTPKFTNFLDEHQQVIAKQILASQKFQSYFFYGGTVNCKRFMLGIFPDSIDISTTVFPITPIKISFSGMTKLTHSDFLGSIMGLQLERDCVGDIIVKECYAIVFVKNEVAEFVIQNLKKIGRANVTTCIEQDEIPVINQEYSCIKGTVASMRLDCIISLLMNKSRAIAVETILSKRVFVNYSEVTDISQKIIPTDVVVIRGYGKFLIDNDISLTKKNRFHVTVKKFI